MCLLFLLNLQIHKIPQLLVNKIWLYCFDFFVYFKVARECNSKLQSAGGWEVVYSCDATDPKLY